jgi:hypothetical protein
MRDYLSRHTPFRRIRRSIYGTVVAVLMTTSAVALPDDCPPVERGWWVRVCEEKTEAAGVNIDIGLGGDAVQYTRRF